MTARQVAAVAGLSVVAFAGCGGGGHAAARVDGGSSMTVGAAGPPSPHTIPHASNSPRACPDLFDQTALAAYSFEISAADWAALDADFHDLKDVVAGTPPQTYYPIVFHSGSETVTNAAVRLRGKSSWVTTVMFDANPKMQFDISTRSIRSKNSTALRPCTWRLRGTTGRF
jgi:hypothetical protein